jgi:4-diphosphocytidyl-2-C-methyl-D-erythritol kinase
VEKTIKTTAHAKINLSLRIVGKRDDGYHLLDSTVVFSEYGDEIRVTESDTLSLEIVGEFARSLQSEPHEKNLVWKAAIALREFSSKNCGANITLTKNLPIASGIGGGSADAAATLIALNTFWGLNLSQETLADIALKLGADVPVCLYGKPAIMRGIGEDIREFTMAEKPFIVLINPNKPLATTDVFREFAKHHGSDNEEVTSEFSNDLEDAAIELMPEIGDILVSISYTKGCYLVNMSGSGATCFGLYHDKLSADNAKKELQGLYPDAWCVSTAIK